MPRWFGRALGTFDDLIGGTPLILILAGVQDPGNVGTLVRTAEALALPGVAACAVGAIGTANPFSPKALRASAGAALRLPIVRGTFRARCFWRNCASPAYASAPLAPTNLSALQPRSDAPTRAASAAPPRKPLAPWEIDWRGPVALLIGNEGAGLPDDSVRSADAIVRIPHAPQYTKAGGENAPAESLNAAIAGSILLYEAARQRGLNS